MKKIVCSFILLGIVGFVFYGIIVCVSDINATKAETDVQLRDKNNEEYIYKEQLLHLGYTIEDVNIIEKKVSNTDAKKYLLNEKYDNLTKFIASPYFKIENISRYNNYYNNNTYTIDNVVIYVNIGLDNEFYSTIKEITDYNEVTALVNKYNKLPSNYEASELVSLDKDYSESECKVKQVILSSLKQMMDDVKNEGMKLNVISGYRTESTQENLFNNSVKKNGESHALIYSAKPGHSEHQLGLAVDFNNVTENFKDTKEYEWLKNNSYKYGFIERYPKDKEFITGYGYEPWHYRYLGIDIATKIYQEGITYEEYLVKYAK